MIKETLIVKTLHFVAAASAFLLSVSMSAQAQGMFQERLRDGQAKLKTNDLNGASQAAEAAIAGGNHPDGKSLRAAIGRTGGRKE